MKSLLLVLFFLSPEYAFAANMPSRVSPAVWQEILSAGIIKDRDARRLELSLNDNNKRQRMILIGYYAMKPLTSTVFMGDFVRHVGWFIDNDPTSEILFYALYIYAEMPIHPDLSKIIDNKWSKAIKTNKYDPNVIHNASIYYQWADPVKGKKILNRAISLYPDNGQLYFELGSLNEYYRPDGKHYVPQMKDAVNAYARAYELSNNVDDKAMYGLIYAGAAFKSGDNIISQRVSVDILRSSYISNTRFDDYRSQANILLGRIALKKGDKRKAIHYLYKAAEGNVSRLLTESGGDKYLMMDLLSEGETQAAIGYLKKCKKLNLSNSNKVEKYIELINETGKLPVNYPSVK